MWLWRAIVRLVKAVGRFRPIGGYMDRWVITFPGGRTLRVHHIRRPDTDLVLHDHPWNFRTRIVEGFYLEEDVFGGVKLKDVGDAVRRHAHEFHRIALVSPGGVVTLVTSGPRINLWGFMVDAPNGPRKVRWDEYQSPNGRADP